MKSHRTLKCFAVRTVLALALAAATLSAAFAQGSRHDGIAFGEQGRPVAGATISVCAQPANVTVVPCTPLANLYTDATLSTPAPNPLTSDGLGNYHFYAAPGAYTVQIYGPGINTYTMPDVILPANPADAQFGSISAANAISALTLNLGGNLSVGGNASITGALTAGSFSANFSPSSNAQLKGAGVILYVDSTSGGCGGSGCTDANDGKSLGTAMATLDHAVCSLPGGNCAAQIAGSGTIYFVNNSNASSTSSCGLWLMGTLDPNYSSPPPCWLKTINGSNGLRVVGIASQTYGPNGQAPSALLNGGSTVDRSHPLLWLAAPNGSVEFDNLSGGGSAQRALVIGECSNGNRTGTCNTSGVVLNNVHFGVPLVAGYGPSCDLTGGSFWIRINQSGCNGTDTVNSPTSDNAAALLIDGRTNGGNGLVFINDFETAGGGIKFYAGANGGGVNLQNFTTEGEQGEPAVWFAASGAGGDNNVDAVVNKVTVSDATAASPAVQSDIPGANIVVSDAMGNTQNLAGPMTVLSQYTNNLQNQSISPQRAGQSGFVLGWNYGKRDDVQRAAAFTRVRFPNAVAGSTCASWQLQPASNDALACSGVADPFGGTNAGEASASAAGQYGVQFLPGSSGVENVNLSVGQYIIAGVWVRSKTADGFPGSAQTGAYLSVSGAGFAAAGNCDGDSVLGDGQWTWDRCIYKITAVGTNPAQVQFGARFDNTHTVDVYGPVLNFIPAGALSDNEAYAYENALVSYDARCSVGAACGLSFNPAQAPAFQSLSANPAQSGVLRLADSDFIAWRNHAGTADVTLSKNSSDQLVAPPFASPTFFSPAIDSSSGASGLTFRNAGSTVWTADAASSALSFNFNAHLGETALKLAPFGGQSYAGLIENYGMTAGFVSVAESSGTASFDAGLGNTFELTLTADVTSSTLSNAQPGQWLNFIICQPASGGPYTFAWPSSVRGGMTIGATAGKCSAQSFVFDGSSAFAVSPGSSNE